MVFACLLLFYIASVVLPSSEVAFVPLLMLVFVRMIVFVFMLVFVLLLVCLCFC